MSDEVLQGLMTLVCLTCGKEQYFTKEVPALVTCPQCAGTVFRSFATQTEPDEAAIDALESQARSMAYGDSSPDTTRDDVRDLDLL
jgi:predicted  nucleic acid-binding Zn-ribbon protein